MFKSSPDQAACGLVFFLFALSAQAGSLAISPVRVTLSVSQPTGSLTVRNDSAEPTAVQLELMDWSQSDGSDVLKSTSDLLVTPPIFTILPGGSQVVRVGLRRAVDPRRELTYRLLLRELPTPPVEDFQGLRMVLNISLPVFILPTVDSAPVLRWRAVRAEGGITISMRNAGNAHVQVANFRLAPAGVRRAAAPAFSPPTI